MINNEKKLFGTDGIRGTANKFPMTSDIVLRVGQAIGYLLQKQVDNKKKKKTVVIGKDTRLSGYMIEQALSSGLNSMGVHVQLVGPLPTPGIGFLTQNMRADAGIVISASHNPYYDNGIKIFGSDGFKIPLEMESEIERLVFNIDFNEICSTSDEIGRSKRIDDATGRYVVHVKNVFPLSYTLDGLRIVLDCANGASYKVAPAIFSELGAEIIVIGDDPDGTNINNKSGALYPDQIAEAVHKYRADVGISFDGDADRVVMADEYGHILNGDHLLAICALHLKELGCLVNNTIVTTEMSNYALTCLMKNNDICVVHTKVGDKYVVEEMKKHGYILGGESSGHMIFLEHSTTGDGIVAALNVLAVMKGKNKKLSELKSVLLELPQVLINLKVKDKKDLYQIPEYEVLMKNIEARLGQRGRVFVRYSGTESVIRILVEGPEKQEIIKIGEEIADFLQKAVL